MTTLRPGTDDSSQAQITPSATPHLNFRTSGTLKSFFCDGFQLPVPLFLLLLYPVK